MTRSAAFSPPPRGTSAPATSESGINAVSALEASAIERSNPATFWKRLTTRSTKCGRSQNVSVRATRARSNRRPADAVPATSCSAGRRTRRGALLGLDRRPPPAAVDQQSVDREDVEHEDRQREERRGRDPEHLQD